jgi:flagellar basal-body rod protein FlgB|tara:strand:+ start:93 stop:467 length:375 start_codon:yes stop_codon:yes gene_type:complete
MNGIFGLHEQALNMKASRLEVLAKNIANADTPGFKAQDVDFQKVLAAQSGIAALTTTHVRHLKTSLVNSDGLVYTNPYNQSLDGNTVEIAMEQAKYGKAAMDYQASLDFIQSRIGSIKRALKGD